MKKQELGLKPIDQKIKGYLIAELSIKDSIEKFMEFKNLKEKKKIGQTIVLNKNNESIYIHDFQKEQFPLRLFVIPYPSSDKINTIEELFYLNDDLPF